MTDDHVRVHESHPLLQAFGADSFGRRAEAFARFFGTPRFLIGQTVLVAAWIILNVVGAASRWDPYPFILLNLAFSLQAAYAAPLILLAQTRQADRDKLLAMADANHREAFAAEILERLGADTIMLAELRELLVRNTDLTAAVHALAVELRDG